jgi:hypothetical protein
MTATIDQEVESIMSMMSPLGSIVQKLEYQNKIKEDRVVPTGHVRYDPGSGLLLVGASSIEETGYSLTDVAHDQISEKLGIPRAYYQKLKTEFPQLLGENINGWLGKKEKTKYLLRTFNYGEEGVQNMCRAMLSNRYNILDNYDVLIAALEAIQKTGINVEIVKAEITDSRMYLHVIAPEIHHKAEELLQNYMVDKKAKLNEGIVSGFIVSNSELGLGAFEIAGRAMIKICNNGAIDKDARIRKTHIGAMINEGFVDWSENTRQKNYELVLSQIQDAVKVYLSKEYLGNLVSKLAKYTQDKLNHPTSIIETIGKELQITDNHKQAILKHFYRDSDESSFGMMQAVTKEAQNMQADLQYTVEAGIFELLPKLKGFDKENKMSKN